MCLFSSNFLWSLVCISYPPQDHVLLLALPAAVETLEVVTVTDIATQLETVVRILCRPANLVSSKPGCLVSSSCRQYTSFKWDLQASCQIHAVYMLGLYSSSKIVWFSRTLAFTQSCQTFSLQDCLPYISVAMLTLCLQPMVTMSAIRIASAHNL